MEFKRSNDGIDGRCILKLIEERKFLCHPSGVSRYTLTRSKGFRPWLLTVTPSGLRNPRMMVPTWIRNPKCFPHCEQLDSSDQQRLHVKQFETFGNPCLDPAGIDRV